MPDFKVSFDAAGTATWGRLARTSESLSTVSYAGWLGVRLQIEGRGNAYLKCFLTGMDDVSPDGKVPKGFGALEMTDLDGDQLWGKVDWYREKNIDKGLVTFKSGSGKWRGASGEIPITLFYWDDGSLNIGFFEGQGTLQLT
jgi:hypothetical protein